MKVNLGDRTIEAGLLEKLQEKDYASKHLSGITYRTLNYWGEQGFLLSGISKENRQWRKFSFTEIVWIRMLDEYRKLGVAVEKVINPLFNHFSNNLADDEKQNIYNEAHYQFALLLAICIEYQTPASIRVFLDGSCSEVFGNPRFSGIGVLETEQEDYVSSFKPFISISIDKLLLESVSDIEFKNIASFQIVNEHEAELLKLIHEDNISEVIVNLGDKKPEIVEVNKINKNVDWKTGIYDRLRKQDYATITFKTKGGKTTTFEKLTKTE